MNGKCSKCGSLFLNTSYVLPTDCLFASNSGTHLHLPSMRAEKIPIFTIQAVSQ